MGTMKEKKNDRGNATAREKERKNAKVPYADFRFVRLELTEPEKDNFRSLLGSGEFESLSPDDFLPDGYKVSFTSGDNEASVICSISQPFATHHNHGLILTGRGRDSATALAVCAYKHLYLCEDTLWREAEQRRGGSYSDIA